MWVFAGRGSEPCLLGQVKGPPPRQIQAHMWKVKDSLKPTERAKLPLQQKCISGPLSQLLQGRGLERSGGPSLLTRPRPSGGGHAAPSTHGLEVSSLLYSFSLSLVTKFNFVFQIMSVEGMRLFKLSSCVYWGKPSFPVPLQFLKVTTF